MKTTVITGTLVLCATLLGAQSTQKENKQVKVRVKQIEKINGVETVKDTSYVTDEATAIKAGEHNVQIIETNGGKEGKKTKTMVITGGKEGDASEVRIIDGGDGAQVKMLEGDGEMSQEIQAILKEAGLENAGKGQCVQKTVIIDSDAAKDADGKAGEPKKVTKITVIKRAKIVDASDEDLKLVNKQTGITDNKLSADNMNFYPNPSNGKFNLSFDLKQKGNTEITILNIEGKKIYSEKLGDFSGSYNKEIDISKNPKGVYFVRIEQGSHSQLKKIVLE